MPDNYRIRQIIIIGTLAALTLLLGYAFYRVLTSSSTESTPAFSPQAPVTGSVGGFAVETPFVPQATPLPEPTVGLEEKIQQQTLLALTDFSAVSPVLNKKQDGVLVYKKDGGNMYAINFATPSVAQKISNLTVVGLVEAQWSPIRDRASIFYLDSEVLKSFLHIGTSSVVSLPRDIKSFSWSPEGKQFAYLFPAGDRTGLFITDASGKNIRQVFTTPILDAHITWITADKIMFQTAPSGQAAGFIFSYSIRSQTFRRVAGPLYGLMSLWSPDASHALLFSTNGEGRNASLYIYDAKTNISTRLDFITIPDKCAWHTTKEFYCAVPNTFPSHIVMPDDYLRGEVITQDRIISHNLDTGTTNLVFSGGAMDINNMAVTTKKDYLIFVNRMDGILWRYLLPK